VVFAQDEAFHPDGQGLAVLFVDAVIADVGVGHGYHLAGIGRVGQHFLVSGHGGVENDLARGFSGAGEGTARKTVPSSRANIAFIRSKSLSFYE
jgi:hypothetical protein